MGSNSLDDPNNVNGGLGGGGFYHGRNWRYFAYHQGDRWLKGNGLGSPDPLYGANSAKWAYICFQRLTGADENYLSGPRSSYTATRPGGVYVDPLGGSSGSVFCRAGWLPVRGLLDNPSAPSYVDPSPMINGGNNIDNNGYGFTPATDGWGNPITYNPPVPTLPYGSSWTVDTINFHLCETNQVQSSNPLPTYEMRANYRDRAIDLWQAVMPTGNLTSTGAPMPVMLKNTQALVDETAGGTMVDCDKYEYGPSELNKFQNINPSDLNASDWPLHPSQILALSYLAHAAMMVTGYAPPFAQVRSVQGGIETIKLAWESLNWTYLPSSAESSYPQFMGNQGIVKDALLVAQDAAPGATTIMVSNDSPNNFVLYPGDEITFQESYDQWWVRYGVPLRSDGSIWSGNDAQLMNYGQ